MKEAGAEAEAAQGTRPNSPAIKIWVADGSKVQWPQIEWDSRNNKYNIL